MHHAVIKRANVIKLEPNGAYTEHSAIFSKPLVSKTDSWPADRRL